ncbi:MAG: hypothetical protein ABEK59_09275 [Halobacteria archaeon]
MPFLQTADVFIRRSQQEGYLELFASNNQAYQRLRPVLLALRETKGLVVEFHAENAGQVIEQLSSMFGAEAQGNVQIIQDGVTRVDNEVHIPVHQMGVEPEQLRPFAEELKQELESYELSVAVQV